MGPPGLILLLLGLVNAQSECSGCLPGPGPIAAIVLADIIMTLLIAGGAYCLGGRGLGGAGPEGWGRGLRGQGAWSDSLTPPPRDRHGQAPPPELEPTYQELQGTRGDVYSELKR
ncbi:TYRO protein tyrosine kinase-binding protein [Aegotheles albertisi]